MLRRAILIRALRWITDRAPTPALRVGIVRALARWTQILMVCATVKWCWAAWIPQLRISMLLRTPRMHPARMQAAKRTSRPATTIRSRTSTIRACATTRNRSAIAMAIVRQGITKAMACKKSTRWPVVHRSLRRTTTLRRRTMTVAVFGIRTSSRDCRTM